MIRTWFEEEEIRAHLIERVTGRSLRDCRELAAQLVGAARETAQTRLLPSSHPCALVRAREPLDDLRESIKDSGLSMREVARRAGLSLTHLSYALAGERPLRDDVRKKLEAIVAAEQRREP